MKFSQVAKHLALAGAVSASAYTNGSLVPAGSAEFDDSGIHFHLDFPNSGFDSLSLSGSSNQGIALSSVSGTFSPDGRALTLDASSTGSGITADGSVDWEDDSSLAVEIDAGFDEAASADAYTATFTYTLGGLPEPIQKRQDQVFTTTLTAYKKGTHTSTSSSSSSSSGSKSKEYASTITTTECVNGSCSTVTYCPELTTITVPPESVSTITITSCSHNGCTLQTFSTGVTCITEGSTSYTTFCPLTYVTTKKITPPSVTGTTVCKGCEHGTTSTTSSTSHTTSTTGVCESCVYEGAGAQILGSSMFALGAGIVAMLL